jgi:sulfide:quinone oxidoreductase
VGGVVILGGGFGGGACAVALARRVGGRVPITLIDRHEDVQLCGANPFVLIGERDPSSVARSLTGLLDHGVEVVAAEVSGIRPGVVDTSTGAFPYETLVIALGADYDLDAVPGSASAYGFYDLDRAVRLRDRLKAFDGGRITIAVAAPPIKCPPAPFEAAMLIDWELRRRDVRVAAEIEVCIPELAPLPIAGPEVARMIRDELDTRGIALRVGVGVRQVRDERTLVLTDGHTIETDVPIVIPVHRLPSVLEGSEVAAGRPWLAVDPATLETDVPGVFAIGDANTIPIGDKALPKAGVFAAAQGRTVAVVIAGRLDGSEPLPFDGEGGCTIAFSGREASVIEGRFLGPAGPEVSIAAPSEDRMAAKVLFEQDWRRFRV